MASYHLRANIISRSSGRSSVAAAAYRAGVEITNNRDGLTHDYSNREGVVHSEIMLPDNAPERLRDRSTLWNEVEASETRKNSQTAREIVVALPYELPEAQRIELVRGFAREQFVKEGMIADIAIHEPSREGDNRNHHAHIMLTTRNVDATGLTTKNREWNNKEHLEVWREQWAEHQNTYLKHHDIEARVDHRTLEAQREDLIAQGKDALSMGNSEQAAELTAEAIALDREAQPQLSRDAYQGQRKDPQHPARKLLEEFRAGVVHAKERAQEFVQGIKAQVSQTLDSWGERLRDQISPQQEAEAGGAPSPSTKSWSELASERLAQKNKDKGIKPYEPRKAKAKKKDLDLDDGFDLD